MARIPRKLCIAPNRSVHKIWRGHNKEWNLGSNDDKQKYLDFMNEDMESEKFQQSCELNALCLMSNHTHEVFRVAKPKEFSDHMRRHHGRYGIYFNKRHDRCGKVASDRPKTCLLAEDYHEMRAVFYVHANPIRAKMVREAHQYRWSTHNLFAFGHRAAWMKHVKLPAWYLRLGSTAAKRQRRYRVLFARFLREGKNQKELFLKKLFFGPDSWMDQMQESISQWRRQREPP